MPQEDLFKSRANRTIPSRKDFSGCLDGSHAWQYFGGTTLDEAYQIFLKNSEFHYEDFQYLHAEAEYYYFPVIDRYWREVAVIDEELDDLDFWRLYSVLSTHLSDKNIVKNIIPEITDLFHFTYSLIENTLSDQHEIDTSLKKWTQLETQLHKLQKKYKL